MPGFSLNSCRFRFPIARENAGRIRIVKRLGRFGGRRWRCFRLCQARTALLALRRWSCGVSKESLALSRHCELLDWARYTVTPAIAAHRHHPVVVGRTRRQPTYAHAENRLWMGPVEPDVGFRPVPRIFGSPPVVNETEVIV